MSLTLGVDVGGTKIAFGVVDESGTILDRARVPSPIDDPTALRAVVADTVAGLTADRTVDRIGISAAGFVRADRRGLYFGTNLDYGDAPLADILEKDTGLPVVVENDGNAAAWAEYRFGGGTGAPDQLTVVLGTGVGGGLILGGDLYRGGHGVAAEIGHIGLVRDGILCGCGRHGCLEQYASGTALTREARAAAAGGLAPALLERAGGDPQAVTGAMVTELAHAGEHEAITLFDQLGEALGLGIASFVAVLDPTLVVLGGGVSEAGEVLLRPTQRALTRELTGGSRRPAPELRLASLGNDAAIIGAADLARIA